MNDDEMKIYVVSTLRMRRTASWCCLVGTSTKIRRKMKMENYTKQKLELIHHSCRFVGTTSSVFVSNWLLGTRCTFPIMLCGGFSIEIVELRECVWKTTEKLFHAEILRIFPIIRRLIESSSSSSNSQWRWLNSILIARKHFAGIYLSKWSMAEGNSIKIIY